MVTVALAWRGTDWDELLPRPSGHLGTATYGTSVSARTLTARSLHRHQTQEVPLTLA